MSGIKSDILQSNVYSVRCYDRTGALVWQDIIENRVVDEGLTNMLQQYFKGSGYTAAFYAGLTGNSPNFQASDTMSSHTGWAEVTAYSEASRPAIAFDNAASKSISNTSSPCFFHINADGTQIGGAFITTSSTKGGTTGLLVGGGAFTQGNRTLSSGDTLEVTVSCTSSSS